eukprot:gnl/MRDRNA2_/MRDRNA2_35259_c0_seq1.p1 gnl/MRDRNA2_/MRDRNA2_35259_c0~~gnl/MRDRNA2_/MRDRNA2_35259_c0_seq1.p1  ORF type:complete len:284 (-),score=24.39 gnl/MRDRNA2_/MRDRNA2_35259_c0_seq1:427-1278(-)
MGSEEMLKDPQKMKNYMVNLMKGEAFKYWASFIGCVVLLFWFFSSGDFSFLLTLSSLVSMFSFLMVLIQSETGKSVKGVSLKMMECYLAIQLGRLCAIVPFEGYLPFDKTGDWLYQVVEALTFCLAGSIVYMCRFRYDKTHDPATDTLNHLWLIGPSAVMALIFHPTLNSFLPSDMAWAFALYLESVAVLPQLFMFQKEGQAQPFTAHFLFAQAFSKVISFIFWFSSYSELSNPDHHVKAYVGNWVMAMQLIQLLIMGDFIYHYIRCIRLGVPVSQLLVVENV